jgi:LemA protein
VSDTARYALYAGIGVVVLLLLSVLVMYNRFVRQRTLVEESWGGIDVELTRRHELIPNLVETVRGYAAHEEGVLDQLVRAREAAAAHHADRPQQRESYEDSLGGALAQVLARVEAYPDLKASASFLQLQDELSNTEDRIAAARRFYNGNVRAYNTRVRTFPSNVVAGMFGFDLREFFEIRDQASRAAPAVAFEPGVPPSANPGEHPREQPPA